MRALFTLLLMLCVTPVVFSQSDRNTLTSKIESVYGADFFRDKPELQLEFVRLLKDRISVISDPVTPNDKYIKLSAYPLFNKFNPALTAVHPSDFKPETFNPLIYDVNFFSRELQVFRIDGTDYLLVIQPQNF